MCHQKYAFLLLALVLTVFLTSRISAQPTDIETYLAKKLAGITLKDGNKILKEKISLFEICDLNDPVSSRVFREYGAMFVGKDDIFAGFSNQHPDEICQHRRHEHRIARRCDGRAARRG
jgi:hypothetical protein